MRATNLIVLMMILMGLASCGGSSSAPTSINAVVPAFGISNLTTNYYGIVFGESDTGQTFSQTFTG